MLGDMTHKLIDHEPIARHWAVTEPPTPEENEDNKREADNEDEDLNDDEDFEDDEDEDEDEAEKEES
jgi:hypothetical protein